MIYNTIEWRPHVVKRLPNTLHQPAVNHTAKLLTGNNCLKI